MKNQVGLISLSLSILISSLILANKLKFKSEQSNIRYRTEQIKIIGDDVSPIPVRVSTNSDDASNNGELQIGRGGRLYVKKTELAKPIVIDGYNIKAKFYFTSKLLAVAYGKDSVDYFSYFNNPAEWGVQK